MYNFIKHFLLSALILLVIVVNCNCHNGNSNNSGKSAKPEDSHNNEYKERIKQINAQFKIIEAIMHEYANNSKPINDVLLLKKDRLLGKGGFCLVWEGNIHLFCFYLFFLKHI